MFFEDEVDEAPPKGARVPLKPYRMPPVKPYELLNEAELRANVGGVMFFDVESYPNFWCCSFMLHPIDKVISFIISPEHTLDARKMSWILHNYTCVGFNIDHYDIPQVWLAYRRPNTEYLFEITQKIIQNDLRRYDVEQLCNFKCTQTKTIDLINVAPLEGSLKTYGGRLHSERMQDLPFEVGKRLTRDEAQIVLEYNIQDLRVTKLMYVNLKEELDLRSMLSVQYKTDLMSKSDAQIAEAVIAAEIERITGARPKKPSGMTDSVHKYKMPEWLRFQTPAMQKVAQIVSEADYVVQPNGKVLIPDEIKDFAIPIGRGVYRMGNGGLHSSEKTITHKATEDYRILDRDVASYYPRIILNQRLMPQHIGENFLTVYNSIVERRLAAKKAKQSAIAQGLKITVNGSFGKFGSPYSILYAPDLMIQVTVSGQLCLLFLIEMLECVGIEVLSANTDGVVMRVGKSQDNIYKDTIARWEQITGFETEETEYTSVHSRDVNAYMAIKKADKDGKVKAKGKNVYFDPWSGGADTAIFRFHKNPMATICVTAIEQLIINNVPIEKTIKECTDIRKFVFVKNVRGGGHKDGYYLGKVVRWYYSTKIHGTINYVIGNKKVSESDGAMPCMDLPTSLPPDINYDAYIQRTQGLLEDMGFYIKLRDVAFF